ncbi:MAG: hypothetical protein Q8O99_05880 [bacterium]|nr:hypothetical protein [bacterium]
MSKPIEKKYGGDVSIFKLFKAARTRAEENMEKQIGDVMYTFTFTTGEKLSEKLLERFFFF